MSENDSGRGTTRRGLFVTVGAAAAAGAAGWMLRGTTTDAESAPSASSSTQLEDADRRPGITLPDVPQRRVLVEVLEIAGVGAAALREGVRAALASLPEQPEDAGEVTVTIGFAPEHAKRLWPERAATASELPSFSSDAAEIITGGDLAVQVCAETAAAVNATAAAVRAALGGASVLWRESGYRDAPSPDGVMRASMGFLDGIINPRTAEELAAGVWSSPSTRDTHWVVRRMRIDEAFFRGSLADQEHAVGRRRDTGIPLSGGESRDEIDLLAKHADGEPLVPVDAHARRAHPSHIGRPLMLRRGYSVDAEQGGAVLFIAFLADPTTFVMTQRRLDEQDALIAHTQTDASGCFFVPGAL